MAMVSGRAERPLAIHPRHVPTEQARRELDAFLFNWRGRHSLSAAEFVMLVSEALARDAAGLVRAERTG
jgi:hypothetical protein